MGLHGQVTTPPRFALQQSAIPGDLTVRMHLNTDPIDREDPCCLLCDRDVAWVFTPVELLDMMANSKRVFPAACGRCMGSPAGSIVRKALAVHQPGLCPEDAHRAVVTELRDQFRSKGDTDNSIYQQSALGTDLAADPLRTQRMHITNATEVASCTGGH